MQVLNVNKWTHPLLLPVFALSLVTLPATMALANPTGGVVAGGAATITNSPSEVQINQTSSKVIINWNSFNIAAGETTQFIQPNSSAVALNRVTNGSQISMINGNLRANGKVFIINPNGVLIGRGAHVNTAGFIATSANIADSAFMNSTGTYDFNVAGNPAAVVKNEGQISVQDEGLVAMVAPAVHNNGVIQGNLAKVNLAAGDTFGIDTYGDGLLYVAVSPPQGTTPRNIIADNKGSIVTPDGKVMMTAAAASTMVNAAINNTGVIEANGMVSQNGEIVLMGTGAKVTTSGTLDTSGSSGGGQITVSGHHVSVAGTVKAKSTVSGKGGTITIAGTHDTSIDGSVDASGVNGGGTINASGHDLAIGGTANLMAKATGTGQGGSITLDSTHIASLYGILNTTGINGGGDISVSSRDISIGDTGDIISEATSSGTGGTIALTSINNTRIHGTVDANGADHGGDIDVHANDIYTDTVAVMNAAGPSAATGGTIGFTADNIIGFAGGGKFNTQDFNLTAPTVDFDGDIQVTNASLSLDATTVNLSAPILDQNNIAITDPARFTTNAQAVNVLSDAALIQQGIDLAGNGATVTVDSGNYIGALTIDHSLTLQGDGSLPTLSVASAQPAVVTVDADDVTIRGFNIDGNGSASGIVLTGNNNAVIRNNNILNSGTGLDAQAFDNGNITLSGNTFTNNTLGTNFGSGTIDLTGDANNFSGGTSAMLFDRTMSGATFANLALVNNTLGTTTFNGQTGLNTGKQDVDFENGAFFAPGSPTHIDGDNVTYDGIGGSAATADQLATIEGRLHDFHVDATEGLIFFTPPVPEPEVLPVNLGALIQVTPLARPIVSVADKVINYDPPFEPIQTATLNVDVSIKLPVQNPPPTNLAGLEPAAGGGDEPTIAESLSTIEPAAGGSGTPESGIACANAFLDNKPCFGR